MKKDVGKIGKLQALHTSSEWIFQFWAWQLLAWTLYRYFFSFPEWVDEFISKPIVFVLPVFLYVIFKEKSNIQTIGLTTKNFWKHVAIGLGISALFIGEGILVSYLKDGTFAFRNEPILFVLCISFATAFSEELLSRGFLFSRLLTQTKNAWYSILMSTLMFMAFHIPILVTSLKFQGMNLILFFFTTLFLGVINGIFYLQTKSLVIPILVHMFWNITVALIL